MKTLILALPLLAAAPALAQTDIRPAAPDGAMPLSRILATLEAQPDFGQIESIDRERGYWEIEYDRADGSEAEVEIDAATGQPR